MSAYTWQPSRRSILFEYLGLYCDGLLRCSIVQTPDGWRSVAGLDKPLMRADDKAEVLRRLADLNDAESAK